MSEESAKFAAELKAFAAKAKRQEHEIYIGVGIEAHRSVVEGSDITGAPGQPVDTGTLKSSFILDVGPEVTVISTNVEYAPMIEAGRGRGGRAMRLRSQVGGFHSVKKTIAGFQRIVAAVTQRVSGKSHG